MSETRKNWDAHVNLELKKLVGLGIEEAWPELLDEAWRSGTPAQAAASDTARRMHDKYGVVYVQDGLNPWLVSGEPQEKE